MKPERLLQQVLLDFVWARTALVVQLLGAVD